MKKSMLPIELGFVKSVLFVITRLKVYGRYLSCMIDRIHPRLKFVQYYIQCVDAGVLVIEV